MKALYLTSLTPQQELVKGLISQIKPYGLEVKGHFWTDDLAKMAWMGPRDELVDSGSVLWAILGSKADFEKAGLRYGLSLLSLSAQARSGSAFNMMILQNGAEPVISEDLPTPLKAADVCPLSDASLGAKLVARAHQPQSPPEREYFIDILGGEQLGQWFEIRPAGAGSWPGAMFGAAGAEIVFQAVGPAGGLPEKSVLNYPVQGLELKLGDVAYSAWAVQNEITPETSYYAKVDGYPDAILFGPYSSEDSAEVHVMNLK